MRHIYEYLRTLKSEITNIRSMDGNTESDIVDWCKASL